MDEVITSDDILGKEAVDPVGEILGVIIKLHVHRHSKQIVGLTIDQGFMRPDLYIGISYVKQFGVNVIMLNDQPLDTLKGKWVLSERGNYKGVVRQVLFDEKGKTRAFLVTRSQMSSIKKGIEIPLTEVKEIGNSIILKSNQE